MAVGSRRQLIYVAETDWGVTPGAPTCKVLRGNGGSGIVLGRDTLQSQEMRSDRAVATLRLGNKKPTLEVPFEFSFSSFDDLLEGALFGTWALNVLEQGTTKKYFSIEEGFLDIAQYTVMTGAMVNTLSLNIQNNAIVTGSFGLIGKTASAFSGTSIDSTPDAASTNAPFDSYTGSLKEGGVTIAIVTGINLTLNNGLEQMFALFDSGASRIGIGRANLTGSISAYFDNATLANKFINETDSSLEFTLTDGLAHSYTFNIPKIKYTGANRSMTENNVAVDMPFQALYDSVLGTSLQITRTA